MDGTGIEMERDDKGIVTLWLNNPKHLNALSNKMCFDFCEILPRLADDKTVRAILLRGRGGVFCAGRELRDIKELQTKDFDTIKHMYDHMQKMNEVIYYCPHPTVSMIEKYALGIASMIVNWTDIAIAEENAQLGFPEIVHGITPYGAIPTLLNGIPRKAAMDLAITGRKIKAPEAVRMGLITRSVPADRLQAEVDGVLADIGKGSAAAITKSKQFLWQCENLTFLQGMTAATDKSITGVLQPEMKQGISAFVDKKKVDWSK